MWSGAHQNLKSFNRSSGYPNIAGAPIYRNLKTPLHGSACYPKVSRGWSFRRSTWPELMTWRTNLTQSESSRSSTNPMLTKDCFHQSSLFLMITMTCSLEFIFTKVHLVGVFIQCSLIRKLNHTVAYLIWSFSNLDDSKMNPHLLYNLSYMFRLMTSGAPFIPRSV